VNLFDKPTNTFVEIIYSERKNFFVFFLLLGLLKILFLNELFKNILSTNNSAPVQRFFFIAFITHFIYFLILKIYFRKQKKQIRIKDVFSLLAYSYLPITVSALILFPVEYGIFGNSWFTFDPSPFVLKKNASYLLVGFEFVFLFISSFFLYLINNLFFANRFISVILSAAFYIFLIII
jgi:hypothetical protein